MQNGRPPQESVWDQVLLFYPPKAVRQIKDPKANLDKSVMRQIMGLTAKLVSLSILMLPYIWIGAQAPPEVGHRIHVVAVHDSSLFTMCPPALRQGLLNHLKGQQSRAISRPDDFTPFPERWLTFRGARYEIWVLKDGRLAIQPPHLPEALIPPTSFVSLYSPVRFFSPPPIFPRGRLVLERPRPDWAELAKITAAVCSSGWVDVEVKQKLEKEFIKHKDFVLVDSADKADHVFLVESLYWTYSDPEGGARSNFSGMDSIGAYPYPLRQAAMAIVVPADVYRSKPDSAEGLLDAALWQGASVWRWGMQKVPTGGARATRYLEESAAPEELVGQYVKRERWPVGLPPLGAAWALPRFENSKGARTSPNLKGNEIQGILLPAQGSKIGSEQQ